MKPAVERILHASLVSAMLVAGAAVQAEDVGQPADPEYRRTSAGNYLAGRHAERVNDLRAAADFMHDALENDPENTELLRQVQLLLVAEGRIEESADLAERLVKKRPNSALANLTLAVGAAKDGQYDAMIAFVSALPDAGLNRMLKPLLSAWALAGQGKSQDAYAAIDALSENGDFAVVAALHKGLIAEMLDDAVVAEAALQRAGEPDQGLAYRIAIALGRFYESSGRPEEAKKVYDRFLGENPGTLLLTAEYERLESGGTPERLVASAENGVAESLFDVATALKQDRASRMALIYGYLALSLRPDYAMGLVLIADALDVQKRHNAAIRAYEAVPDSSPFSWHARLQIASNLHAMGDIDGAAAMLNRLATERTDRFDVLQSLGHMMRTEERYNESVEAYDRAIDRVGTLENRHWPLLYARGIALERSKQWARAETDFLQALELEPDQPYVLNYLGYTWVEQGVNVDRARKMIEEAVAQRPDDGFIVDSLGWVHYRMREFEAAVAQLERAVELQPEDPTINDHLGDAYWMVGRRIEAQFQWRRVLSLEPDPEQTVAIEEKLDKGLPEPEDQPKAAERES